MAHPFPVREALFARPDIRRRALRCNANVIARGKTAKCFTQIFFARAIVISIGRVEEGDPRIKRLLDDGGRRLKIDRLGMLLVRYAETHRSQAYARYSDIGIPQVRIFHNHRLLPFALSIEIPSLCMKMYHLNHGLSQDKVCAILAPCSYSIRRVMEEWLT